MVTLEMLKEKREELQQALVNATAEMNAFGGALQFCDHLISELEKEEAKDESNSD
jgi:hypothetical protein